VATLRGCTRGKVYKLRKQGTLHGTPDEPYHFFGWSVLQVMGWMAPPSCSAEPPPSPAPVPPVPTKRTSPAPHRPRGVQGLRHLRVKPPSLPGENAPDAGER